MTAPSTEAERPQKRTWKYKEAAQAYRESYGDPFYTMVWNQQFEQLIAGLGVPYYTRGISWILRTANGNLSPCCVDGMPKVDDRDPLPRRLGQTDMCQAIGCSPATGSGLLRAYREHGLVLPDTEGYIYPNPCVQPSLFASQCENGGVSHLDSVPSSGADNSLQPFKEFVAQYRKDHPEHLAVIEDAEREIARLKELMRDQREIKHDKELVEMAAYREYKRAAERAQRNGSSASRNGHDAESIFDSTPPAGDPESAEFGSVEQKVQYSQPENEVNPSGINETAPEPINLPIEDSSSSGGNATASATTPPVHTPEPEGSGKRKTTPGEPQSESAPSDDQPAQPSEAEFRLELARRFRAAEKAVPTPQQAAPIYARLARQKRAFRFLEWLDHPGKRQPPKLSGVQHPGVLPSLLAEFEEYLAAEPPPKTAAVFYQGAWSCPDCGCRVARDGAGWRCPNCGKEGAVYEGLS